VSSFVPGPPLESSHLFRLRSRRSRCLALCDHILEHTDTHTRRGCVLSTPHAHSVIARAAISSKHLSRPHRPPATAPLSSSTLRCASGRPTRYPIFTGYPRHATGRTSCLRPTPQLQRMTSTDILSLGTDYSGEHLLCAHAWSAKRALSPSPRPPWHQVLFCLRLRL
jgi:hypothetical protein